MDKRTLLAFLLIFIILIGSDRLLRRLNKPAPKPETSEPDVEQTEVIPEVLEETVTAEPDRSPEEDRPAARPVEAPSDPAGVLAPAEIPAGARSVTVTTPLYRVEISGEGARITSWRTMEHEDEHGDPLELVPQGEKAATRGDDGVVFARSVLDLGSRVFASDGPGDIRLAEGGEAQTVTFRTRTGGDLEIRKIYTFAPDTYTFTVDLEVVAAGPNAGTSLDLVGEPVRARFAWNQGIAVTEAADRFSKNSFRSFAKIGDEVHRKNRNDLSKDLAKVTAEFAGSIRFAALQSKYFIAAGVLPQETSQVVEGRIRLGGDPDRDELTWAIEVPFRSRQASGDVVATSRLVSYIGPQEQERLKAFGVGLDKTMDLGWALFRPLAEAVIWIMDVMYRVVPNYGVIIILFSVLTKLLFYPLTRTSTQSMKKMQMLQPKIKELQERYKDNREKQSKAMMELYKKEKVNPMAGCLPLVLQMPVFIALYQALAHTIALRNTPFVLWINDLSQPDALFHMPFSLPFLGAEFNLLPILMSASMWVQTKLTPTGTAGGQMAAMNTMMPVIFLFMFYQMPSGLVIYWLVNNLMTIYQTWRIHQTVPSAGGAQAA